MAHLDYERLEAINAAAFRARQPFPWINPAGLLTDEGHRRLIENLPDPAIFDRFFGVPRSHGQRPHDRLVLEYRKGVDIPEEWLAFLRELRSRRYRRFLQRMFGRPLFSLNFHWHYAPRGSSVSPHCDARHKLGSHIFYLNTADDWDAAWGGQTVVLEDGGRFPSSSAPAFEDFDRITVSEGIGNRSLIFARGPHSWHGVREIHSPENAYRKVFIVVVNDMKRSLRRLIKAHLRARRTADAGAKPHSTR